jgi:hypothetical protein
MPYYRHDQIVGMTERRRKRPRDPAQLAKLIVDIARGEAFELGRRGGLKGGRARAEKLAPETRRAIAARAAAIRWQKDK